MSTGLKPLKDYAPRTYPKARGTAVGKILVAASMAATSLGGCGPALDPHTVDAAMDKGDLDATVDQNVQDSLPDTPADQKVDDAQSSGDK